MFAILLLVLTSVVAVGGAAGGGGGGGGGGGSPATSSGGGSSGGGGSSDPIVERSASYYQTAEYNAQWGLEDIHAAEAYAYLYNNAKITDSHGAGYGVKVAITDTGAKMTHGELSANINAADSYDYYNSTATVVDIHGHGTHVASLAAGVKGNGGMHGVAYGSELVISRIFNDAGTSAVIYAAPRYSSVIDGVKVINASWGDTNYSAYNGTSTGGNADSGDISHTSMIYYLTNYTKANDVVFVAAAGNSAGGSDADYNANPKPSTPALFANNADLAGYVLAVGAVDSNNVKASFSNACTVAKNYCLVAPGVGIYGATSDSASGLIAAGYGSQIVTSGSDKYVTVPGTSQAAPQVSGALAVIRAAWPHLTAPQATNILLTTATDLGVAGVDDTYGRGLLNLYAAVQAQGANAYSYGLSVSESSYGLSQSSLASDPIFGDALTYNVASSLEKAVFFDDYGRDYKAFLGNKISAKPYQSAVANLNGMMLNNYKTNIVPFALNFRNHPRGFTNIDLATDDDVNLQAKVQFISYSNNRSKYLIMDNSKEDKSLTNGNGFSFIQENGYNNKMGFSFNVDELRNQNFEKFNNVGFISVNGFAANPYQSFINGVGRVYSDQSQNVNVQKNFNQLFFTQKLFEDKFNFTFSQQTSYQNSSLIAKNHNKENQISDFNLSYKLNAHTNFAASFGNLTEYNNNMLNSQSSGLFSASSDVKTSYVKFSASWNLAKNLALISSISEGVTKMDGNDLGLFRNFSDLRSRASSVGLIAENAFGFGGKIGVLYSEPLRVYKGSAQINIPIARDLAGNVERVSQNISLKPSGRERNFEFFYSRNFTPNSYFNLNFITTKDAGNVRSEKNSYLLMGSYNLKF